MKTIKITSFLDGVPKEFRDRNFNENTPKLILKHSYIPWDFGKNIYNILYHPATAVNKVKIRVLTKKCVFLEILKIQLDGRKQPRAIYLNEYFSRCLLMHKNTQNNLGEFPIELRAVHFFKTPSENAIFEWFLTNRNFLSTWPEAAGDYIP